MLNGTLHTGTTKHAEVIRGRGRCCICAGRVAVVVATLMQMDYDETSARDLLKQLDEDDSGLIDFQEFCAFIARVK